MDRAEARAAGSAWADGGVATMVDHVATSSFVDISRRGSRPRSKADGGRVPLVEWVRAAHRNVRRRRSWRGNACGGSGGASSRRLLEAVEIAREIAGCCRRTRISDVRSESFFVVHKKDEGESCDDFRNWSSGRVENSTSWTVEFVAGASPGSGGGGVAPRRLLRRASEPTARLGPIAEVSRSRSCGNVGEGDGMFPLGAVLYEVLSGKHPFDEGGEIGAVSTGNRPSKQLPLSADTTAPAKKREKRLPNASPYAPLREFGLPSSLCDLVSSLLDPSDGSGHRYISFAEVEDDLRHMIQDPDRFLFDLEPEAIPSLRKLEFPRDRLYGREGHLSALAEAYERVLGSGSGEKGGGAREVVLLSGYSGTGKSSLMQRARGMFVSRGARFACGKFNKMYRGASPLSAVFGAFDEYCNALLEGSEDAISAVRESIEAAIGCDSRVLTDLIPTLSKVIGGPSCSSAVAGGKEAHNRLRFIFRKFVRAISTPCHPVVLFLDDLQWADETSLELVQFLVTDAENTSFLVVGAYRDNEVGLNHLLMVQLQNMQEAGADITEIKVDNIDLESVNDLISDTLHLLPRLTWPLTDVVYKKTNGNALFLSQLLRSLVDEGLLRFSLPSRRWEWDLDSIRSMAIADNVVELMMRKMLKLPQEVQCGLKIASCLGSTCVESTLRLLEGMGGDDGDSGVCQKIVHSAQVAVGEGLMVKIPGVAARYKFSHDQIQHAAYSLIPECHREALHLRIGRLMWQEVQRRRRAASATEDKDGEAEEVSLIFIAADQMNCGKNLITNRDERVGLARLNLEVGRKAADRSAFLPASVYLLQGVQLLDVDDWEHHYELCLELFSSCVEAQYVIGDFATIDPMLQFIFRRGRCIQDKFRAYYTLVNSVGAQGKVLDAIQVGLNVLSELGERFPAEANPDVIERDLVATRDELEGTTIDRILHKANMQDGNKATAMRFLVNIALYAFAAKHEMFQLLVFRMVQITLSYGICKEAAHGFAMFGMILCASGGDVKGGYCFGKLAFSLLERFKAKECFSAVCSIVYIFINPYVQPVQACLVSLTQGYEVGMSTGDFLWAMSNKAGYLPSAFQCGSKLESLAEEVRLGIQQMKEYKQHMCLLITLPFSQAMFNLMGSSEDPTQLTGEAMDQEEFLKKAVALRNFNAVSTVFVMRMQLAYLFGRYGLAAEMAEKFLELSSASRVNRFRDSAITETFYIGLVAATSARSDGEQKWRRLANDSLRKLKDWERHSSWNLQHRVELLEGEIAFLDEDIDAAAKALDKSIQSAGRHGFINEQALACERAGLFSLELGNKVTAEEYFVRSQELYRSWGAKRKADDITKQLDSHEVS